MPGLVHKPMLDLNMSDDESVRAPQRDDVYPSYTQNGTHSKLELVAAKLPSPSIFASSSPTDHRSPSSPASGANADSGIEIAAIIGCVMAIVSAYRDASRMAHYMQVKRQQSRTRLPFKYAELEASLERAPRDIEIEKSRLAERFTCTLPLGNEHIYVTLLNIQRELQIAFLVKLRKASESNQVLSVEELVNAADLARAKVIGALCELEQRLLEVSPKASSRPGPESALVTVPATLKKEKSPKERQKAEPKPQPKKEANEEANEELKQEPRQEKQEPKQEPKKEPKKEQNALLAESPLLAAAVAELRPSVLRKGSIVKETSMAVSNSENAVAVTDERDTMSPVKNQSASDTDKDGSQGTLPDGDVVTYCYAAVEPRKKWFMLGWKQMRRDPSDTTRPRRDSLVTSPTPYSIAVDRRNIDRTLGEPKTSFSAVTVDSSLSGLSSRATSHRNVPSVSSFATTICPSPSMTFSTIPTKENDYLGFCKGAWKIDVTARAQRRGEPIVERYIPCPTGRCNFAASVFLPEVVAPQSRDMKLRWAFLARSHVRQADMRNADYSYRCIICVLTGKLTEPIKGINYFLEHLTMHRDEQLSEDLLRRIQCVTGRIADNSEVFALNLYPSRPRRNPEDGLHTRVSEL